MTCINNGSALTDNQIKMLSMMIKNKERLGMDICSCDIQRVLDMGVLPPTDRPNIKNNSKASNTTVTINVDAKGLSETVRELLVKELRKRIEFV